MIFPPEWLTSITVIEAAGRDINGKPLPATSTPINGCLVAPGKTSEDDDFSDEAEVWVTIYIPDQQITVHHTGKFAIPAPHPMCGTYQIEGRPAVWPLGSVIQGRQIDAY